MAGGEYGGLVTVGGTGGLVTTGGTGGNVNDGGEFVIGGVGGEFVTAGGLLVMVGGLVIVGGFVAGGEFVTGGGTLGSQVHRSATGGTPSSLLQAMSVQAFVQTVGQSRPSKASSSTGTQDPGHVNCEGGGGP